MPSPLALESLRALAGSPGMSNFRAQWEPPINLQRNQAKAQMAANALGDPSLANGSISQLDLEGAYEEQQGNALAKLLMPVQAKGQYELAGERMKGQNALDVAGVAGRSRVEAAKQQGANTTALIQGRSDVADKNIAGRADVAQTNQAGIDARTQANLKAAGLRQQYSALALQLKNAGTGGVLSMLGIREDPRAKIQAQMEALAQQMAAEGPTQGEIPGAAPAAASGVDPVRMAKLRAAMGR